MDYNNLPLGLRVQTQIPLDVKEYVLNEATLKNLGAGNNLAYTYVKGLVIYCFAENTRYEWQEVPAGLEDTGLLDSDFVYPNGVVAFGVTYSNKKYNFFPVNIHADGSETKIQNGSGVTVAGNGTIESPYIISSDLSTKVDKNTNITAATFPVITYDSKGLVTGGRNLLASDVPILNQNTTGTASTITGTIPQTKVDNLLADLTARELIGNKQNNLNPDPTNTKYPTVTAVIAAIAGITSGNVTSEGTVNYLQKITADSELGNSMIYEDANNLNIGLTSGDVTVNINSNNQNASLRLSSFTTDVDTAKQGTLDFIVDGEKSSITNKFGSASSGGEFELFSNSDIESNNENRGLSGIIIPSLTNEFGSFNFYNYFDQTNSLLKIHSSGYSVFGDISTTIDYSLHKLYVSGNTFATSFVKDGGLSTQFLKADGSVDSNTYLTTGLAASTYEPIINAGTTAQYWRGDKTWQTLDKAAVGLANVDNTTDAAKPISTATQTALDTKENVITAGTTAQYWRGDKTWQTLNKAAIGLSNVDNTSDVNKPVSSATQIALDLKQNISEKNQVNGYAGLGSDGKIQASQLPSIAISDTFVIASQAAMLALTAQIGDVAVRTDLNKTFILKGSNSSVLTDWQELLSPTNSVSSVFGRTGAVIANSGDYNTSQVTENTNLYFTISRARTSLSFVAGSGAYDNSTGVLTIPTNTNQLTNGAGFITGLSFAALTGKPTTLSGYGITDAYPLTGNPSGFLTGVTSSQVTAALGYTPYNSTNPSGFITSSSLAWENISGRPTALSFFTNDLGNYGGWITSSSTDTLTNKSGNISQWTNNSGYITGINSTMVTTALGYTPYNSSNPSGYITGYTETDTLATVTSRGAIANVDITVNGINIGKGAGSIATNTRVGVNALASNTTGLGNTAIGNITLQNNTIGNNNTAVGNNTLSANTSGYSNSALGVNTMLYNTTGYYNSAVGNGALHYNTSGFYNSAVGSFSLFNNTTGVNNSSLGYYSLYSNTLGINNSALGSEALYFNIDGNHNSAVGARSLYNNTTGDGNSTLGWYSLLGNTTGNYNVGIGYLAGRYIADKSTSATILNNSVMIGYQTSPLANNQTNQIVIGYNATGLGSNSTVIGNSSTTKAAIHGNLLLGTTTDAGYKLYVNGTGRINGGVNLATSSGNVGIGAGPASQKLDVNGNIRINNGNPTANTLIGILGFGPSGYGGINTSEISANFEGANWYNGSNLIFKTSQSGDITSSSSVERMRITSGGQVQISSPISDALKLINTNSGAYNGIIVQNDASNQVVLGMGGSTVGGTNQNTGYSGTVSNIDYYLMTNNSPRLLITSGGNVGIGTNSPSEKLQVAGNVLATGFFQSSDLRLKDIISRDGDVIKYKWKDKRDDKIHIGYVAQEVQKENPDQVNADEKGILSVNYIEILVQKIKDLENRIKQLEK